MINSVNLTGRLTKDPETRVTSNGVTISNFTLAVNRTFTDSNGERQADFINCIVFKKQAENVQTYLHKGDLIGITGRLQSRSYDNNEGKRVYVVEVVGSSVTFLQTSNNQQTNNQQANNQQSYNQNQTVQTQNGTNNNPFNNATGPIDISDDDLPF